MAKEKTFEENMKRLEEIVAALEDPDLSLEKGIALYKEGAKCSKECREKLENAKHELEVWQNDKANPVNISDLDDDVPF